jgi:hypothetical protein
LIKILTGNMPGKLGMLEKFDTLGKLILGCGVAFEIFCNSVGLVTPAFFSEIVGGITGIFATFIMAIFGIPKLPMFAIFNMLGKCIMGKAKGFMFATFNPGGVGLS